MKTQNDNSVKDQNATCDNNVLVDGFSEDDELEAVFLIQASSENVFNNRRRKLKEITGFSDGGCGSYEKVEGCDVWKIIVTGYFNDLDELKNDIQKMKKHKWLFLSDSSILFDGEYIFSDGDWFC